MSVISEMFEFSNGITSIITAVSTAALATCATFGLRAWRTEHKEKAKWDVAKRASIAVRKIQSGMEQVRRPNPVPGEAERAKLHIKNQRDYDNNRIEAIHEIILIVQMRNDQMFSPRLDGFIDLRPEIDAVCRIDIDAEWNSLFLLIDKYFCAVNEYGALKGAASVCRPTEEEARKASNLKDIVYASYDAGRPDKFAKQVNDAVIAITDRLEGFLNL